MPIKSRTKSCSYMLPILLTYGSHGTVQYAEIMAYPKGKRYPCEFARTPIRDLIDAGFLKGPFAYVNRWDVTFPRPVQGQENWLSNPIQGLSHSLPLALASFAISTDFLARNKSYRNKLDGWICTGKIKRDGGIERVAGLRAKLKSIVDDYADVVRLSKGKPLNVIMPHSNIGDLKEIAETREGTLSLEARNEIWILSDSRGTIIRIHCVRFLYEAQDLVFGRIQAERARKQLRKWSCWRRLRAPIIGSLITLVVCAFLVSVFWKTIVPPRGVPVSAIIKGESAVELRNSLGQTITHHFKSPVRAILCEKNPPVVLVGFGAEGLHGAYVCEFETVNRYRWILQCSDFGSPYYSSDLTNMDVSRLLNITNAQSRHSYLVVATDHMLPQSLLLVIEGGCVKNKLWVEGRVEHTVYLSKADSILLAGTSSALGRSYLSTRTDRDLDFIMSIPSRKLELAQLDDPLKPTSANWWKVVYPQGTKVLAMTTYSHNGQLNAIIVKTSGGDAFRITSTGETQAILPRDVSPVHRQDRIQGTQLRDVATVKAP